MAEPVLATIDLCKRFDALQVSRQVNLDVKPGEIHALIGPNGAGKSSLVAQIAGGLRSDSGQVLLNGRNITSLDVATRARQGLARTFQVSALAMQDTVFDNVLLGAVGRQRKAFSLFSAAQADAELLEIVQHAIQRMELSEFASIPAAALSHGQRRQLEIAIALTLSPCVFVMDEPMAGMGAQGTRSMIRLLDQLRHEAPILMVEHDMDAVFALADRISVLVYGEIIATGTPQDIKRDERVQQAYLGIDL